MKIEITCHGITGKTENIKIGIDFISNKIAVISKLPPMKIKGILGISELIIREAIQKAQNFDYFKTEKDYEDSKK